MNKLYIVSEYLGIIVLGNELYFKFQSDQQTEIKNSENNYLKNLITQINKIPTAKWKVCIF